MKDVIKLVVIEKLDPKEYDRCCNIWDMDKQPHAQKWYDEIVRGVRTVYIYKLNGEWVGEGALVFDNGDHDYTIPNQRIYMSRLIVKDTYRGMGIGGSIIDYLTQKATALGYQEITVGVDLDNVIAHHLYKKKGFRQVLYQGIDEQGEFVKLLKKLNPPIDLGGQISYNRDKR